MSDLRTAAQQALEALDLCRDWPGAYDECSSAITALRAALAQQEQAVRDALTTGTGVLLGGERIDPASVYKQQEPAFWGFLDQEECRVDLCFTPSAPRSDGTYATPYYTHPPRREWVSLSMGEALKLWGMRSDGPSNGEIAGFARAIEQALKERNNG